MSAETGSRVSRALLGGLGPLLVAFAVAFVYVPTVVPPAIRQSARQFVAGTDVRRLLLLVGAAIAVYGLLSSWLSRAPERSEWLADRSPELPEQSVTVSGAEVTAAFHERRDDGSGSTDDDGPLKEALRDTLVAVYARERGDEDAATRYVDGGHWTDDRYACAFVTATDAVDYPLYHRLFAWLYPGRAYEYRVRRALRAVESVCARHAVDFEPPDREMTARGRLGALLADAGRLEEP